MTTGLARFSLAGRGALVTGGTKGIGLAIVRELTELGAQVVTCARTVDSAATAALPPGVHVIQADVASRSDRERLLEKATSLLAEEGGGGGGGGGIGGGGGGTVGLCSSLSWSTMLGRTSASPPSRTRARSSHQ